MSENRDARNENMPYNEQVASGRAGGVISEYTVEEKDTLEDIARKHKVSIDEIMAANSDTIHQTSDLLQPGVKLKIPKPMDDQ